MEGEELELDPDLMRVLGSGPRLEMLRALRERRMTPTELAERQGVTKATILQHLEKLVEAGLVRREEDERLWVYYALTSTGRRLSSSEPIKVRLTPRKGAHAVMTMAFLVAGTIVLASVVYFYVSGFGANQPQSLDNISFGVKAANDPATNRVSGIQMTYTQGPDGLDAGDVHLTLDGAPASFDGTSTPQGWHASSPRSGPWHVGDAVLFVGGSPGNHSVTVAVRGQTVFSGQVVTS